MKKTSFLTLFIVGFALCAISQNLSAKEKAEYIAKNEFSKSKYKKIEKYGVVKEMNRVIISTPVVHADLSDYAGNYVNVDGADKIEIRTDAQKGFIATLVHDGVETVLKNVTVQDAYFTALESNRYGTEERWEGVFINKNDNGTIDFGLGIKLTQPVQRDGLQITKVFFKKVSP